MSDVKGKIPPRGGSDIMEAGLKKRLNLDEYNAHVILSRCTEDQIADGKLNIMWQHLNYNEPLTNGMTNKFFTRAMDAFVYVSHWQHEKFRYVYHAPVENAFVIKNAIEPIEYIKRDKNEKIKLIYTSAPYRGLEVLLDSFELLNRDDVELEVYSSTIVYGSDYDFHFRKQFEPLFERAANTNGVNFHGYAPNSEIIKALQDSHIFAYPSVFEETCCLAMIEAGAAGCSLVAHNLGALPETGTEYATFVPIKIDKKSIAETYAKALNLEIDTFWDKEVKRIKQSEYFNTFYSWDSAIDKWHSMLKILTSEK